MRQSKTVLVLGAGASQKFGLPLGKTLKDHIASDLNITFEYDHRLQSGSPEIVEALRLLVRDENGRTGDINPHRAAAVSIARSMRLSGSIDEFVERHKDDPKVAECAKLAIAKSILQAERTSSLFLDHRHQRNEIIDDASESWLAYLLRDLTRGLTSANLEDAFRNLHIINFNYDRCVELFTFLWFQQVYGLDEARSARLLKNLKIYHPFGTIGDLPFQNSATHTAFGGEVDGHRLASILPRIKTYSEAVKVETDLFSAKDALGHADRVVFLGFAFHEQNMQLMQVGPEFLRASLQCYATTCGISAPRLELDKRRIVTSMQVNSPGALFFEGVNGTCEEFWTEYGDVIVQ